MPSLPKKSSKGANFKTWTVDTVDALIEYFNSNWIQEGSGISVRRTASGVVIGLAKTPPVPSVKFTTGGGSTQDISANVSGGTAFIMLSGSTSAAKFVGTGSVTISGNTNTGNIEINATGGTTSTSVGFPDYSGGVSVSGGTPYVFTTNGWLIGSICNTSGLADTGNCECNIVLNGNGFSEFMITLYKITDLTNYNNNIPLISKPVFLPIPAGVSFQLNTTIRNDTADISNLKYYPCIS
jgi:hypothetical protein